MAKLTEPQRRVLAIYCRDDEVQPYGQNRIVLRRLEHAGLLEWRTTSLSSHYRITHAGRLALQQEEGR